MAAYLTSPGSPVRFEPELFTTIKIGERAIGEFLIGELRGVAPDLSCVPFDWLETITVGGFFVGQVRVGEQVEAGAGVDHIAAAPDEGCLTTLGSRTVTVGGFLCGQIRVSEQVGVGAEVARLQLAPGSCEAH